MTFTVKGANIDDTIKNYKNDDGDFSVEYLSGKVQRYFADEDSEVARLNDIILKQALFRDENFNLSDLEFKSNFLKFVLLAQGVLLNLSLVQNCSWENSLIIIFILVTLYDLYKTSCKIRELKKYKIFLEIREKLMLVKESELLKCVEHENFYQKPLNISTLDEYSYGEIKRVRVKLNEMLKKDSE